MCFCFTMLLSVDKWSLFSCALFMVGTCSAFFVIIADLAPVVFAWVASIPPDLPYLRILILFSLAVSIIFPLSLLRQLDSLSTLSTASIGFYAWLTIQVLILTLSSISFIFIYFFS